MEIELLGLVAHRRPGSVLEPFGVDVGDRLGEADDRRQPNRGLREAELVLVDQPGESIEPDLHPLTGRIGEQNAQDTPREADEVELAPVLLDQAHDLGHHLVPGSGAEARLQAGELVEGEEGEGTGSAAPRDPFELAVELAGERLCRERTGDRVLGELRAG